MTELGALLALMPFEICIGPSEIGWAACRHSHCRVPELFCDTRGAAHRETCWPDLPSSVEPLRIESCGVRLFYKDLLACTPLNLPLVGGLSEVGQACWLPYCDFLTSPSGLRAVDG